MLSIAVSPIESYDTSMIHLTNIPYYLVTNTKKLINSEDNQDNMLKSITRRGFVFGTGALLIGEKIEKKVDELYPVYEDLIKIDSGDDVRPNFFNRKHLNKNTFEDPGTEFSETHPKAVDLSYKTNKAFIDLTDPFDDPSPYEVKQELIAPASLSDTITLELPFFNPVTEKPLANYKIKKIVTKKPKKAYTNLKTDSKGILTIKIPKSQQVALITSQNPDYYKRKVLIDLSDEETITKSIAVIPKKVEINGILKPFPLDFFNAVARTATTYAYNQKGVEVTRGQTCRFYDPDEDTQPIQLTYKVQSFFKNDKIAKQILEAIVEGKIPYDPYVRERVGQVIDLNRLKKEGSLVTLMTDGKVEADIVYENFKPSIVLPAIKDHTVEVIHDPKAKAAGWHSEDLYDGKDGTVKNSIRAAAVGLKVPSDNNPNFNWYTNDGSSIVGGTYIYSQELLQVLGFRTDWTTTKYPSVFNDEFDHYTAFPEILRPTIYDEITAKVVYNTDPGLKGKFANK